MPAKKKIQKRPAKPTAAQAAARRRRLGVVAGFVLVSACMFFVGVLVGRGTAPVHFDVRALQDELLELRQKVEDKRRQLSDPSHPSGNKAEDLQFYEALKTTGEAAARDPLEQLADFKAEPGPVAGDSPGAQDRALPAETVPPPAAPVQPAAKTPAEPAAQAKATEPAPSVKLTIQVASVRDSRSAGLMVEKLRGKGYPAYSHATRIPGKGIWYRVRIGEYDSRSSAEQMLKRLGKDNVKGTVASRN